MMACASSGRDGGCDLSHYLCETTWYNAFSGSLRCGSAPWARFQEEGAMKASRRDVLLQGCVIGAGIIAANVTGLEALAQQVTPKLRRSLHGMAPDDPILQTWRDGVRMLKAANGDVSWASFAAIHGDDQNFKLCPHGNWFFLPWHRAYILTYERAVRN